MSDFSFNIDYTKISCYNCGIIFAVPTDYRDNRYKDGNTFYCPNQHKLHYPKRDSNGESIEEKAERLDCENSELRDIIAMLRDRIAKVTSELDQAQAHLRELSNDGPTLIEDTEEGSNDT